jgi:hypothetical protein
MHPPGESQHTESDFTLLDYKSIDDFLYHHKCRTDNQKTFAHLAKQLKASRSLVALTKCLSFNTSANDMLHRFVESACAIIDAEHIYLLRIDPETKHLVGSLNSSDLGASFHISSGVEC